jgi:trk system potassium uptake protein TrkA
MLIIIAGAGEVGFHLAKMLSDEKHDLYIIDSSQERLNYVQSQLDVFTVKGDASNIQTLKDNKISSCDLLIAATSIEETNMLICITGKKMGAKKTIARISNYEHMKESSIQFYADLGVDNIVSPVALASQEIVRLINQTAFIEDYEFEGGKLTAFGICITGSSPLTAKPIKDTSFLNPNRGFKPIAILRKNEPIIVINGDSVIHENDIVYFISTPAHIGEVIKICGQSCFEIKNIMILGGSPMGVITAEALEKKYNITLIEKDKKKAEEIANRLKNTLVINVDGRNVTALEEENLEDMDAFISLTGDSETNIISSLVAKSHNVKKTIARVENIDYIDLSHNIGIDTLINKKIIAANEIFKYVRKGEIKAIVNLHDLDAELIEFNVKEGTKITRKPLRELKFPKNSNIAGVIRNDEGIVPFGGFQLQAGDKAVVFVHTESVPEIEDFFN